MNIDKDLLMIGQMDIEKIGRSALQKMKDRFNLPNSGFIAGGSISNLMWEEVSGNEAVINDIDIFYLNSIASFDEADTKNLFTFVEPGELEYKEYDGYIFTHDDDYYKINSSDTQGYINEIRYTSNTHDPMIILKSFDINCTMVGYSIDEDKFYYTDNFVDFLKTGDLKVQNVWTPAHTAIRIIKKEHELKANLADLEMKILQQVIVYITNATLSQTSPSGRRKFKLRFKERYFEMYKAYLPRLCEFFNIRKETVMMQYVKNVYGEVGNLYTLQSNTELDIFRNMKDTLSSGHWQVEKLIFYIRDVHSNEELRTMWNILQPLFGRADYVDIEPTFEQKKLLSNILKVAPGCAKNLSRFKMSEQLYLIDKLFSHFKEDPLIALCILEEKRIDLDIELTDDISLLLELSVRKSIVKDDKRLEIIFPHLKKESDLDIFLAVCHVNHK